MAIEVLATMVTAAGVLVAARRPRRRAGADHGRALVALARVTAGRRPVDRPA